MITKLARDTSPDTGPPPARRLSATEYLSAPRQLKNIHQSSILCFCAFLWLKNSSCNLVTASCTRSSSITKVKLILDAPCEINVTLMSLIVLNTRAGNSRRSAQTFTNHTNDRSSLFDSHRSELFQFRNDRRQRTRIIQRKRHADFGSRHHIYHRAMPVKHFKQRAQKTVSAKHARGSDLNGRDTCLVRDRFDCSRRRFGLRTNERAGSWACANCKCAPESNSRSPAELSSDAALSRRNKRARPLPYDKRSTVCASGTTRGSAVKTPVTSVQICISSRRARRRLAPRCNQSHRGRASSSRLVSRTDESAEHRHDSAFQNRKQLVLTVRKRFRHQRRSARKFFIRDDATTRINLPRLNSLLI